MDAQLRPGGNLEQLLHSTISAGQSNEPMGLKAKCE
jgi:hypothetical protein